MADPKLPKQLTEESPLVEFAKTGNLYVDPSYKSAETTPEASPITEEALVFGVNAIDNFTKNSNNSPDYNLAVPADGGAYFVSNLDRGTARGNGHDYFFSYKRAGKKLADVYIINSKGGDFSASPRTADKYVTDSDGTLNVYIEGSTFGGNLMGFGSQTDVTQTFTGNYEFTFKNSVTQWFCITYGTGYGLGEGNAGNNRFGTVIGNIDLVVDGSTVTNNGAVLRGGIHGEGDEKAYIKAYFNKTNTRGDFGIIMTGCGTTNFKSTADLDITITGSTLNNFMMLPNASTSSAANDGSNALDGNIAFKFENSTVNGLVIGAGRTGDNLDGRGWVKGNISFNIIGSTNSGVTTINKGKYASEETPGVVDGTIENSLLQGAFIGFQTGGTGNEMYADTTLRVIGSTTGNFSILSSYDNKYFGKATLEITGSTTGNLTSDVRGVAHSSGTFDLVFKASETKNDVGAVSLWNTMTVDAGANVRATSVANVATLTLKGENLLSAGTLSGITTLSVEDETLTKGEVVLVSGLTEYAADNITTVKVNGTEFGYGIFGGQYSRVGSDLVAHMGTSFAVNSNYTGNGVATELGILGYKDLGVAQATAKTSEANIVFTKDPEVGVPTFAADVNTLDIQTLFVGADAEELDLGGNKIIAGDATAAADAALSADVSLSYLKNIKGLGINVGSEGTARVIAEHIVAGEDAEYNPVHGIGEIDLTTGAAKSADISISDSDIGTIKIGTEDITGTMVVNGSTIAAIVGGKGNVVMTGSLNEVKTVYAEGNAANIQLENSTVNDLVAGLSSAAAERATLDYTGKFSASNFYLGDATVSVDPEDPEQTIATGIANKIGKVNADIAGGSIGKLFVGVDGNDIGAIDLKLANAQVDDIVLSKDLKANSLDVTLSGGTAISFQGGVPTPGVDAEVREDGLAGGLTNDSVYYGVVYGGSFTALDGGIYGKDEGDNDILVREAGNNLNVEGNAKVGLIKNFKNLSVTGGTLNVAGGDRKSVLGDDNVIEISDAIVNRRAIQAGSIKAGTLTNSGLIGTIRDVPESIDETETYGIQLSGALDNSGYIKTSTLTAGNFANSGKIVVTGDVTANGTFNNSGELFFISTVDNDAQGTFHQDGGLILNNEDLVNTGFISAGSLKGVKNLSTSKLYVTGGAEIKSNLTIDAGAEVAFTNKANPEVTNGLTLGGSIFMADSSNLIVSGDLTTTGSKTITITVGDNKLIGANEIVKAEGGVNAWTINWKVGEEVKAENDGPYSLVRTDTSIVIYSQDELYINSKFSDEDYEEGESVVINGKTFLYGMNLFGSVEKAVVYNETKSLNAKLRIFDDATGMDVDAAAYDVILDNSTVGKISAKSINVVSDSTFASIQDGDLYIDASALATMTGTMVAGSKIYVDATKGSGSRLVFDVPSKFYLDPDRVTVLAPDGKSYGKTVLGGNTEHTGDLFITSTDNVYTGPGLFTKGEGDVYTPSFVDGEAFDKATGDALFNGTNVFLNRADAEAAATAASGSIYLVGYTTDSEELKKSEGINTVFETASGGTAAFSGASVGGGVIELAGASLSSRIYGIAAKYDEATGNVDLSMDKVNTGSGVRLTGDDWTNVTNGNINATITNSRTGAIYVGSGSFGTDESKPIDINVTIQDSNIDAFYGIQTRAVQEGGNTERDREFVDPNPNNKQIINANLNLKIYDSVVGGTVTALNTDDVHWDGYGATLLQTYFTAGSINFEIGNSTLTNNIRTGLSLEGAGKAPQAFNVTNTLHIVATDKGNVTTASYLCEWDTIIVDATAQLQLNTLQYTTVGIASGDLDNAGTLTQVMINMSGYKSGTHTVIQASNEIYTDAELSNITVIGDNDMTGRCKLSYDLQDGHLKKIVIFDKADDMYIDTAFTAADNGRIVEGQELLYKSNAHNDLAGALVYADEWHGDIIVYGGEYTEAMDFHGNNAKIYKGVKAGNLSLANDGPTAQEGKTIPDVRATTDATMTIQGGAEVGDVEGSMDQLNSATLEFEGSGVVKAGDISEFDAIELKKGVTVEAGNISDANISMKADGEISAKSVEFADAATNLAVDVAGYAGKNHALVLAENGISGTVNVNKWTSDADAKKPTKVQNYAINKVSLDEGADAVVILNLVKNDVYVNSLYVDGYTELLEDGTYLWAGGAQAGSNAFSDVALASEYLGGEKYTMTITGGELGGAGSEIKLGGASFVLDAGKFTGDVYACTDTADKNKFYSGKTYTVNGALEGDLYLTAGNGVYTSSNATITLGSTASTGNIIGAGDTVLKIGSNNNTVGLITGVSELEINADGFLKASGISLGSEGKPGTIKLKRTAFESTEGNRRLIIDSDTDILNINVECDEGIGYYNNGKQIYAIDLTRVYFSPKYTVADNGSKAENGDTLLWGINMFNDYGKAIDALLEGGTVYVSDYTANDITTNNKLLNLVVSGGTFGTMNTGLIGRDKRVDTNARITIDNTYFGYSGNSVVMSNVTGDQPYNHRNTIGGSCYITITASTIGNRYDGNARTVNFNDYLNFTGPELVFDISDTLIADDLQFFGDGAPITKDQSVTVNLTNVTAPNNKWWWITQGNPGYHGSFIVNIKDSSIGASSDMRFGSQGNWQWGTPTHDATITFTVDNSYFSGFLTADSIDPNRNCSFSGVKTLKIAGASNYVGCSDGFDHLEIDADSFLSGSTVALVGDGLVKVNAEGYTGPTKTLVRMSTTITGLNGVDNTSTLPAGYLVVYGSRGIVLSDGTRGNLFYDKNYETAVTGRTVASGDILIYEGDDKTEGKTVANALNSFEDAKAIQVKGDESTKLFAVVDEDLFDDKTNAVYATIADEEVESTKFVNLVISNGDFSNAKEDVDPETGDPIVINPALVVAAPAKDEIPAKTVTGNATVEIAGGTWGKAPVAPTDEDPEGKPAVFAKIDGSKDSVGGTSTLVLSSGGTLYATVTGFDAMKVASAVTVKGDIDAGALTISAADNGFLTADALLGVTSITIDGTGYTGASRKVLVSDDLANYTGEINVVGDIDKFLTADKKSLYVVSHGAGNVYFSSDYVDKTIDGTESEYGDLLFFNVNAFNSSALTAETLIGHTNKDYTAYVLKGEYADLDLTAAGQINLQVEGGTFTGSLKLADDSVVTLATAATTPVSIASIAGSGAEDAKGYALVVDPAAATTLTAVEGINAFTLNAVNASKLTAGKIDYLANGGKFTVDFDGYTVGAGTATLLTVANGINNFLQYEGEEGAQFTRTVIDSVNNKDGAMVYYDENAKAVKVVKRANAGFYDTTANNSVNGTTETVNGVVNTKVYGYNVNSTLTPVVNQLSSGDILVMRNADRGSYNTNVNPYVDVIASGVTLGTTQFGATATEDGTEENGFMRVGTGSMTFDNVTFTNGNNVYLLGRGNDGTHRLTIVAGTLDEGSIVDGIYTINLTNSGHTNVGGNAQFRATRYARIGGGTINVNFQDYALNGDIGLFDDVYGYEGQLNELNVTLNNVTANAAKYVWFWDTSENNSTKVTLTITNSSFGGGTDTTIGFFGDSTTTNWTGEATLTINGVTSTGTLSGSRGLGVNGGDVDAVTGGTRILKVDGTNNNVNLVKMFSQIQVSDDAFLSGSTVSLSQTNSGFLLLGDATEAAKGADGKYGNFKEYISVTGQISGADTLTAKFVDKDNTETELEGYTAVVGSTSVFVYKKGTLGDIYYSTEYSAASNGLAVVDAKGNTTHLMFGENAFNKLADANTALAAADPTKVAFHVEKASSNDKNIYAQGFETIVNGGNIENVFGGNAPVVTGEGEGATETAGEPITTGAKLTVNSGASVTNITVSTDLSKVTGASSVTIGEGTTVKGTISAGDNTTSTLEFKGAASAKAVAGFTSVKVKASDVVTLSEDFAGAAITIDAADFADYDKVVMVAASFGDVFPTVTVEGGAAGFDSYFSDFGEGKKALVIRTGLVKNTYAKADWNAETANGFEGYTAITFNGNAFASAATAADKAAKDATVFIKGGEFSKEEAVTVTNGGDVIVEDAATLGAFTSTGALTVNKTLNVVSIDSVSALTFAAGDKALTVDGAVNLAKDAKITINVDAKFQADGETAVLTTAGGITVDGVELADGTTITLAGEGANRYYAFYDQATKSVNMVALNTLYLSSDWAGADGHAQNVPKVFQATGDPLFADVNAFGYMNSLGPNLHDGQNMWATHRTGSIHTGYGEPAEGQDGKFLNETHITDGSVVDRIVLGGTTGERIYVGDTHVFINNSTVATATGDDNDSWLVSNVTANNPWDHRNTLVGNVTVDVEDSVLGDASNAGGRLYIVNFTNVVDKSETEKSAINVNFKNTKIYKSLRFIGDSPMGSKVKRPEYSQVDGVPDGTTETLNINLDNVQVDGAVEWAIRGGGSWEQVTGGVVTVNMKDTTFGANAIFAIEDNWSQGDINADLPACGSDFIFNIENTKFNGVLSAGRRDYNSDIADLSAAYGDDNAVWGYTGARVLNVTGANTVKNSLYFKTVNMTGESSLKGDSMTLFNGNGVDAEGKLIHVDGQIVVDLTGYEGPSRVLLGLNYTTDEEGNVTGGLNNFDWAKNLKIIGNDAAEGEEPKYTFATDYDDNKKTVSTIVLKGAVKDVYVNSTYEAENFKLGTSLEATGEALFYGGSVEEGKEYDAKAGYNAFSSLTDVLDEDGETVVEYGALRALQAEGTILHVTGFVETTALLNNSITIDDKSHLLYTGSAAITVNGDVVNNGQFTIDASEFIKGGDDKILVLTADSITGAAIQSTSPLYEVDVRLNELTTKTEVYLVLKADDVYVSAQWRDYEDPTVPIEIDGKTLYYGYTAFDDTQALTAYNKVSEGGTLTVVGSDVSFGATAISKKVKLVVDATSSISNTTIGANQTATLTLKSGASASGLNVMDGSTLTVESGVTVTKGLGLTSKAIADFASGSTLDFNIVGQGTVETDSAKVTNFKTITGTPNFTATIDDAGLTDGVYALASGLNAEAGFTAGVMLKSASSEYGTLTVGGDRLKTLGAFFSLSIDGDVLVLTKETAQDTIYVNSNWKDGEKYTIDNNEVVVGVNGFSTGDAAAAKAISADASTIKVVGGAVSFTNGIVTDTVVANDAVLTANEVTGSLSMGALTTLSGKAVFNPAETKTVTIDGTVAFDTANTADGAQIAGFGKATFGDTAQFTLTVSGDVKIGDTYLLASGVETFDKGIKLLGGDDVTLTVGAVENIGDFGYTLVLDNGNLSFAVVAKQVPEIAYVNSEWINSTGEVTLSDDVTKATIGVNAFATYGAAVATGTAKVLVDGGEITFANGSAAGVETTVGAFATIVGKNVFTAETAITVDGSNVLFDTALSTDKGQIEGFSFMVGTATYELAPVATAGTYVLASGVEAFTSPISVTATDTISVGDVDKEIGSFKYTLELTDAKTLVLTVAGEEPPTPVVTKAYVSSDWTGMTGEVDVPGGKATIGYDAFVTIAEAEAVETVTSIEVVGGKTAIAEGDTCAITIDADATLTGKFTATENITVNGTFVFDTEIATDAAAQLTGYASLKGDAKFVLVDAVKADETKTYILASDADAFNKAITVNGEKDITVGGEKQRVAGYDYSVAIDDNNNLVLTVEKYVKPTDLPTHVYVNNTWPTSGTVTLSDGVTEATIGIDAFLTYGDAFNGVKEGGTITVDGGEISFPNGVEVSVTNEVGANATLAGKSEFASAITVNGTILFAAADAGADEANAQIKGFSFISGNATYQLSALSAGEGTYYLATGLNGNFTGEVELLTGTEEPVYLTVSGGAVEFGDYTYQLGYTDNNALTVTIAKKSGPVPPPPTSKTFYANSDWTGLAQGAEVDVPGGKATIGTDAFATADEAAAKAVGVEDAAVDVLKGVAAFSEPIVDPTVIGNDATLVNPAKINASVTVDGTVAFDASKGAFEGFENVTLGEFATLTLTAEPAAAGTDVVLATGAADLFKANVKFNDYNFVVGAPDFFVAGDVLSYVLDLDAQDNLVLSYVALENKADNGWNNSLNAAVIGTRGNAVDEFSRVLLDEKGTVFSDGFYNFVNSVDTADYAKITVSAPAKLSFTVTTKNADDKVKFSIFSYVNGKAKSLKSVTVSKGVPGETKEIYVDVDNATGIGTYYVAVENKNKKSTATFYNVELNAKSLIYEDADNGDNNTLYEKKVLNPKYVDFENNPIGEGDAQHKTDIQLDSNVISGSEEYSNWVGFGDATDYARIELEAPAKLSFSVTATDNVKLTVYSLTEKKGKLTLKALKSATVNTKKGNTAAITPFLMDVIAPVEGSPVGYYVSVTSTNAKKGGNAYYNVEAVTETLYSDADNGANSWLLQNNTVNDKLVQNDGLAVVDEIQLDEAAASGEYSNFVGFGDEFDYAEFSVTESGMYNFNLKSTGKAKLVVYSVTESKGKLKSKALLTVNAKAAGATPSTKAISLEAGTKYFVSVQATDAKKGAEVNYDVQLALQGNSFSSALDMPEAAVADTFKQDDLFVSQTVDAIADAAAFNAESQLIDEKQSWQSIAALA